MMTNSIFLWVSSYGGHRVRRINMTSGIITTFVGTGTPTYNSDNILATSANVNNPREIAVNDNYLWVSDSGNHRVRRVDLTTSTITTYAGNGTSSYNGANSYSTSNSVPQPIGIFLTSSYLYITSYGGNSIYRVTLSDQYMIVLSGNGVSGYVDGQSSVARFNSPQSSHSFGDRLWVSTSDNRIRLIRLSNGVVPMKLGNYYCRFTISNRFCGGQRTSNICPIQLSHWCYWRCILQTHDQNKTHHPLFEILIS
eukprot:NODE_1253_length_2046_cov_10.307852_g1061_i0.p1 GENE.NODE_1253_length_2046_cov_10.307852_g1061_i0~~NODE_1253_length_2046_cov_10.307852_g1061_i0.p1  ORF type:complete len:253 (-),score=8.14 NODE_1253_length_2046_cov_10.307852_g1061_i0:1155-1913(-)